MSVRSLKVTQIYENDPEKDTENSGNSGNSGHRFLLFDRLNGRVYNLMRLCQRQINGKVLSFQFKFQSSRVTFVVIAEEFYSNLKKCYTVVGFYWWGMDGNEWD